MNPNLNGDFEMASRNKKSKTEKRVGKIFKDLRDEKKIVNDDHYLVSGEKFESKKLLITKRKWIKYPEKRLEKKHLSDDAIRWALLHEEGHLSEHKGHHYFACGLIFIVLSVLIIIITHFPTYQPFSYVGINFTSDFWVILVDVLKVLLTIIINILICVGILLAIIFSILFVSSRTHLKETEIKCDIWAAKKLIEVHDINNPSVVVQEFADWVEALKLENKRKNEQFTLKEKCFKKFKDFFDPHPPWCVRIERLKDLDEDG